MERVWFGTDGLARAARVALAPAERLFAGASGLRTLLYDAGWIHGALSPIPIISVGNLTVGGTGKTPVAAWIARWLVEHGARPAVIMRGYGNDEPAVHRELNPDIDVILGANRRRAVAVAVQRGHDIAVLDDAFQHRQLQRTVDIVLISADRWSGEVHLLPAGPWREPVSAIRRADLVIVTTKASSPHTVDRVHEVLANVAPRIPRVSVRLATNDLVQVNGAGRAALMSLHDERVTAVVAIADPATFVRQLELAGARVDPMVYRDHHEFSSGDIEKIVATAGGSARVICTLKDAVKLRNIWPRVAPPLWYVSQRVSVERGVGGIEQVLEVALRARHLQDLPANSGPV
jgi:tetraacyldisaccharide 4'-kinase